MTADRGDRPDAAAAIEALRARGAQHLDPVRWRHIEALARRAAAHEGATRRVLDARLAQLLAACADATDARRAAAAPAPPPTPGPLARLLADIAGPGMATPASDSGGTDAIGVPAPQALKVVRQHGSTWSRLGLERGLQQARARVPDNAGPLNTQRLLHETLATMRETSPAYLQRLLSHVEALLWLEQSMPTAAVRSKETARAGDRESTRRTPKRQRPRDSTGGR